MTKTERRRREQFNADGLPRDAKLWTVADWKSLWDAYRQIVREVGERHAAKSVGQARGRSLGDVAVANKHNQASMRFDSAAATKGERQ